MQSPMKIKDALQKKIAAKPHLIKGMLAEASQGLLDGEIGIFKSKIRESVNGTIGWQELAESTGLNDKSLIRMFSEEGNPSIINCTAVLCTLRDYSGVSLTVKSSWN